MFPPPPPPKMQIYGRRPSDELPAAPEEEQQAEAPVEEAEEDPERQAFEAMLEQLAAEMQKVGSSRAGAGSRSCVWTTACLVT